MFLDVLFLVSQKEQVEPIGVIPLVSGAFCFVIIRCKVFLYADSFRL